MLLAFALILVQPSRSEVCSSSAGAPLSVAQGSHRTCVGAFVRLKENTLLALHVLGLQGEGGTDEIEGFEERFDLPPSTRTLTSGD